MRSAARVRETIVRIGECGKAGLHIIQIMVKRATKLFRQRILLRMKCNFLLGRLVSGQSGNVVRVELIPLDPRAQEPQNSVAFDVGTDRKRDRIVVVVEIQLDREELLVIQSVDGISDATHTLWIIQPLLAHFEVFQQELAQLGLGGVERHPTHL